MTQPVETPYLHRLPRKNWDDPMWQFKPIVGGLKELEEEKQAKVMPIIFSAPKLEESLDSIAESLKQLVNRQMTQEKMQHLDVRGLTGSLHGMTYRGYSLQELDTMIDFYRMQHIEKGNSSGRPI